jgi:large subunit ribosomal protein L23
MIENKPNIGPEYATFHVPLRFTKFDLRDYLWHLYGVDTLKVHSWVKALPARRKWEKAGDKDGIGPWVTPKPHKFMMAHLAAPFIFPEPPTDKEPFDHAIAENARREREARDKTIKMLSDHRGRTMLRDEDNAPRWRIHLAKEARSYLSGEKKWENLIELDPRWEELKELKKNDGTKVVGKTRVKAGSNDEQDEARS